MASNYTTNYNLCQWQPTDQVQRTDFNADNAKLDAALATKAEAAALNSLTQTVNQKASQSALNALNTTVQQIQANLTKITFGTYTGDRTAFRVIDLGFTPSALYLRPEYGSVLYINGEHTYYRGGLVLPGHALVRQANSEDIVVLGIVEEGFQVAYVDDYRLHLHTNDSDFEYFYIAFQQ